MKLILVSACVLAVSVLLVSGTLLDLLKAIHQSPTFNNLTHAEQLLIIELFAEAEAGELHNYIDNVGFANVLTVLEGLPANESHLLTTYLIQELNLEEHHHHGHTTHAPVAVGRRDLAEVLSAARHDAAFQDLAAPVQELVINTLKAAESMQLTAFIQHVGYSTVLQLVDIIPDPEKHMFEAYLVQHLQHEASAATKTH